MMKKPVALIVLTSSRKNAPNGQLSILFPSQPSLSRQRLLILNNFIMPKKASNAKIDTEHQNYKYFACFKLQYRKEDYDPKWIGQSKMV